MRQVHLGTLATGCQSPAALQQLMDSGFLTLLATALCEFCNAEMLKHSDSLSHPEVFTDAAKSRQLNQGEADQPATSSAAAGTAAQSHVADAASSSRSASNPPLSSGNPLFLR